jgi:hypothetical protein
MAARGKKWGQSGLPPRLRTVEEGSISYGLVGFKENRTDIRKARVQPEAVIKGFDVVEDGAARLGEGGWRSAGGK